MKAAIYLMMLFTSCWLYAGNEGGHAGDPLILDFFHRAHFVRTLVEENKLVDEGALSALKVAIKELKVEMTDESLPSTGRVVWDPERPGKRKIVLDRQKYYIDFFNRFSYDLNLFVAHEVWETRELDINKEITQHLQFRESDFVNWYNKNFQVSPVGYQSAPDSLFLEDIDSEIKLTIPVWYTEKPGELKLKYRDNDDELELVSLSASASHHNAHELVFRHRKNHGGRVGVILSNTATTQVKHYEFEFRSQLEHGNSLLIETKPVAPMPEPPVPVDPPAPLPANPPQLSDTELGRFVGEFNARVAKEKPWGAYYLTEEVVKASIKEQMPEISEEYQGIYQSIADGKVPKTAYWDYHVAGECPAPGSRRYFMIRLMVMANDHQGYSLRVGKDFFQACP